MIEYHEDGTLDIENSCVCHGGELNPCYGCSGKTISLLSGDSVPLTECPWMYTYHQESFIVETYGHYQNGHLLYSIADCPSWLSQGMNYLNMIAADKIKREAADRKRK